MIARSKPPTSGGKGRCFVYSGALTPAVMPYFWMDNDAESFAFCLERYEIARLVGFDAFYDCADTFWLNAMIGFAR